MSDQKPTPGAAARPVLVALVIGAGAAAVALAMLRPVTVTPAGYVKLGQALFALQESILSQQTKVASALLLRDDSNYELQLRAARNTALGSVPGAAKEVENSVREVFAEVPSQSASKTVLEALQRLQTIEQKLEARLALHIESAFGGPQNPEVIEAQRLEILDTTREAVEVATGAVRAYQEEWPKSTFAELDAQTTLLNEARGLIALALVALLIGAWMSGRRLTSQAAQLTQAELQASALGQTQSQIEVERDQLRQGERRVSLELALLRLEQKSLTESMRSAVLVCDTTLLLRLCNHVARTSYVLSEQDLGRSVLDLPALKSLLEGLGGVSALSRLLTEATRIEVAELRDERKEGTRWYYATVTPYVDEAGHVRGLILIADDITQAIETRNRLMQTERLAAMGRLSAQVTHEIRNPLSAIALNADLLDEEIDELAGKDTAEAKSLLRAISREVERLTEVTDEYLRLARLRPPAMHSEDVNHLLVELVEFLGEDLRRRHITARVELDAPDARVLADAAQLRQAFMNIIKNSMESMPSEGGSLYVRTRRQEGRIVVEVKDNGVGIPEHVLTRIFDPFYTTKEGGTGLGLPITQQIVAEHGGELTAESSAGQGTRICVMFPSATV
jgi:signal transduction histidine kinase